MSDEATEQSLRLSLIAAPDDEPVDSPKFQASFAPVGKALSEAGIKYSQRAMAFDAIDVLGYALPEYVIPIGGGFGSFFSGVLITWIRGRAGRKVRMKVGDVVLEAQTPEDIARLTDQVLRLRPEPPAMGDKPKRKDKR